MRCENCRFFAAHPEHDWVGSCNIKLPPHMQEAANNFSWGTRSDNECDLGQPKVEEAEE